MQGPYVRLLGLARGFVYRFSGTFGRLRNTVTGFKLPECGCQWRPGSLGDGLGLQLWPWGQYPREGPKAVWIRRGDSADASATAPAPVMTRRKESDLAQLVNAEQLLWQLQVPLSLPASLTRRM